MKMPFRWVFLCVRGGAQNWYEAYFLEIISLAEGLLVYTATCRVLNHS